MKVFASLIPLSCLILASPVHAQLYSVNDLGTLGGATSLARSINNSGTVVGYSDTSGGAVHAFSYSGGVMTDLGTLGGPNSYAFGINSSGTIAGYADYNATDHHAFSYSGGVMTDLGTLSADPTV